MKKSFSKLVLFLLVSAFLITVAASITCNILIFLSKNKINTAAASYLSRKASLGKIFYFPPDFIILKNVTVFEPAAKTQKQFLFVPTAVVRINLTELIARRNIYLSNVYLFSPRMQGSEFIRFFRDNFSRIIEFLRNLPVRDVRLFINKARLDFSGEAQGSSFVSADFALKIKGDALFINGSTGTVREIFSAQKDFEPRSEIRSLPLFYVFKGSLKKDSLAIERLEFKRENIFAQFWGDTNGKILRLHGYTFMNTLFKEINYQEPYLNFLDKARIFLRAAPPSPSEMGLAQSDLYVLDIDCSANLNYPNLEIKRLCFSLNNIPLSIKGKAVFGETVNLDLALVLSLANLDKPMAGNFKKIELGIKGSLGKEGLKGDGQLNLDFIKKKKSNTPLERIELGFKDLKFYFTGYPVLALFLGQVDLFCRTENNDYRILLRDFNSVFNLGDNRFKSVEYNCRFYDGFLKGLGKIDWLQSPPRIISYARIKGVSANKLDGVLMHFSKVFGKLSSQMRFSNYPHLNLKGGMLIERGYARDFEFFKWLADFFALPALKKVDFSQAKADFIVDEKGASLHHLRLDGRDLDLAGYFSLGQKNLISSKVSLTMTKALLRQSAKFTPLLRLLKEDWSALKFDFQLSGNLHGMNFKWLESDFKQGLQNAIPGFIQRQIEKNIEETIRSISAK